MTQNRDGWWLAAVISPLILLGAWMLWPDLPRSPSASTTPEDAARPNRTSASDRQGPEAATGLPPDRETPSQTTTEQAAPAEPDISLDRLQNALANIAIDNNGDLVLDEIALASLRQAFRALQDAGPETLEQLKLYVESGLAGETGAQAASILGNYIGYRKALMAAEAEWVELEDLSPREKLERTIELRRDHMEPLTASQLFAGEDAHQRYLLALEEVRSNHQLSREQRQEALTRLQGDLRSGILLVNREGNDAVERLRTERQEWESMGLGEDTRNYLEQQTLGLLAARDLTGSDRQDWQNRYDQFTHQRNIILTAGLTEAEKAEQVEGLIGTYFTDEEVEAVRNWLPQHLKAEINRE